MSRLHDSILATIGRTPVVRINRLAPPGVNLYVRSNSRQGSDGRLMKHYAIIWQCKTLPLFSRRQ